MAESPAPRKPTRLMKALVLDENDGNRWVYSRQPHWRKQTVAEWTRPDGSSICQYTLKELVLEIVVSNNAQHSYHAEMLEATKRPPLPEPVAIDYAPIVDAVLREMWARRAYRVAAAAWDSEQPVSLQPISKADRADASEMVKVGVEKAMRDKVATL